MVNSYNIGPYRMGSTLGVGTFGKVKLAVHEITGQKVAIKVINKSKMQSMNMHEKIRREINILQCLNHPHVIRMYELVDTPTDIFMVMEYVPGGELFDHIVQKSRLPEHEARRFFQQIVSGVEYCHNHMVCHRDLKPENVFLDTNMNVKVGDFGLSNFMREGDFLKTSCGSPNYASPEVVSGKAYAGPEVDVWSCGVILYALLCGSLPFDDEHVPNLFKKIKHGNFILPGHLSENSRSLIVHMLVVDPAKRITFKEIRRHPWFRQSLPDYLSAPNLRNPLLFFVDNSIVDEMRKLGYDFATEDLVLKPTIGAFPNNETVAYQLLADKRAKHISYSSMFNSLLKEYPTVFSKEAQKRVANAQISEANLSLFSYADTQLYPSSSTTGRNSSTFQIQGSPIDYSPGNPAWTSSRWKLGIESVLDSATLATMVLNTLRALNYEWFMVTPFKIRCRPMRISPKVFGSHNVGQTHLHMQDISRNVESEQSHTGGSVASLREPAIFSCVDGNRCLPTTSSTFQNEAIDRPINKVDNTQLEETNQTLAYSTNTTNFNFSNSPHANQINSSNIDHSIEKRSVQTNTIGGGLGEAFNRSTTYGKRVHPPQDVILAIQLYKIASYRYLIDVQLFDGSTVGCLSEALWVTSAIFSALTQIQHQQQTPGNSIPTWSPTTPVILKSIGPSHRLFG